MRLVVSVLMIWFLVGFQPVKAGDCGVAGPPAALDSESVDWTFNIANGQTCLRGLRSGAMLLDSVIISAPAKFGEATVQGYAFSYKAPRDFQGEDFFSVVMSGTNRGIRGKSVINVHVSVR
jgi:hypothetical protein